MNTNIVQKYRKKPVIIEAIKLTEHNYIDVSDFVTEVENHYISFVYDYATLKTPNGETHVSRGDYVVKSQNGFFYVLHPEPFESEYEVIPEVKRKFVCNFHSCKKEINSDELYCKDHGNGTWHP